MKKFNVHLYFHGSYCTEVNAETEAEALEIAHNRLAEMTDEEFLWNVDPQFEGSDVYLAK